MRKAGMQWTKASEILHLIDAAVLENEPAAEAMLKTTASIEYIKEKNVATTAVVRNLWFRVRDMAEKFQGMEQIAQRMNALVLSTKIFAAQAGKPGQGFLPVVKELDEQWERVQEGTRSITQLLDAIREDSKNANEDIEREAGNADPVNDHAQQIVVVLRKFGEHCAEAQNIARAGAIANTSEIARHLDAAIAEVEQGVEAVAKTIAGIYRLRERGSRPVQAIFAAEYRLDHVAEQLDTIQAIARRFGAIAADAQDLAAQAGKYRPGFQVIAEETEKLGKRLTALTQDAKDILDSLQAELKSEQVAGSANRSALSVDPTVEEANRVERALISVRNICADALKIVRPAEDATHEKT